MTRTSQGLVFAAAAFAVALAGVMLLGEQRAEAQVVIQGQVSTYGQPQPTYGQPGYGQPQPQYGGSPYVAGGSPQPVRYVTRSRSITALWVPGLIMTLVGWVGWSGLVGTSIWASCYGSSDPCPDAGWAGWNWIPIIGPWLSLAQGYPGAGSNDYTWFSVIGGLLEDVGLIMFILGLTLREEWEEPVYALGDGPDAPTLSFRVGAGNAAATISF